MLRYIFRVHPVIVIAKELDHVFEESPLPAWDPFREHFCSFEHHRERLHIRDRWPDLVCHRAQDRDLLRLGDLTRLQLAKAGLRVRADDLLYRDWDCFRICRRCRFMCGFRFLRVRARSTLFFTYTISTANTYMSVNGVGRNLCRGRNISRKVSEMLL